MVANQKHRQNVIVGSGTLKKIGVYACIGMEKMKKNPVSNVITSTSVVTCNIAQIPTCEPKCRTLTSDRGEPSAQCVVKSQNLDFQFMKIFILSVT